MAEKHRVLVFRNMMSDRLRVSAGDRFDVVGPRDDEDKTAWLKEHGAGIEATICIGIDQWDKSVLDALPDLKLMEVLGAGMDGMDLEEIARRGIHIENSGELHAGEVADFAMTMMLAARRDLLQSQQFLLDDKWKGGWCPPSRSLVGAKVGIAGLGHIGLAIARRCEPFIPAIAWWGPRDKPGVPWPRRDSLLELAREVDILFVAVFAHPKMTRHLINKEIIEALGSDWLLVNVSRGFVVDELELIAALKDGRLGQAALDVFDPEPTDPKRWDGVPNVLLTPHIAGATRGSNAQLERHTIAKVCEFLGIKEDA
jgi:hydroxypyruvate reductase